ncbi:MAG TPA: UDP-N-acetylmuramoyl-L-alanyl-D-glutamate--2,6-diaminopimelate ligase [Fimbriimonadaceae bacterium]|nr:UDP-N-acetylmuramoyl-L-alanyl-D-glutamate--2,6-diaminopimelate ligase [Fimbriimonadaceae bacterium]
MRFTQLLAAAGVAPRGQTGDAGPITGLADDSRQVQAGGLFVCMPSANTDSHRFLVDAQRSGAVAAIVHSEEGLAHATAAGLPAAWIEEAQFIGAVGRVSAAFLGPIPFRIVGITGTNGKTTTAWMMRQALPALGMRPAYLGTLGYQGPCGHVHLENTTPFPVELYGLFAHAASEGVDTLVMETSSHALAQGRVAGVPFTCAVFTNLSQDHLDFHGTMEAYEAAKRSLFVDYGVSSAAIGVDDPVGARWLAALSPRHPGFFGFGEREGALRIRPLDVRVDTVRAEFRYGDRTREVTMGVGGLFNVANSVAALGGLIALGFEFEAACDAMASVHPVPGRFEAIANDAGIGVLVDYAHTPDALEKLLASARALDPKRLITVFGCGGDRDRTKRPQMAAVVSAKSDLSVITSDNPRTEDPHAIVRDVEQGLVPGARSETVIDRREAIFRAVALAEAGDIVVIAGKGHEDYQIIGRTKHPMDDRQMAREALEARG